MLRLHKDNERRPWKFLLTALALSVFKLPCASCADRGEANDVVQECFFHLYRSASFMTGQKHGLKNGLQRTRLAALGRLDRRLICEQGFMCTDKGSLDGTLLGETDLDREIGCEAELGSHWRKAFDELPASQRVTLGTVLLDRRGRGKSSGNDNSPWENVGILLPRMERLRKSGVCAEASGNKKGM